MGKTFSTGLLTNGIWQDASNNIGIGGSPSGSFKLDVTGTGRFTGSVFGDVGFRTKSLNGYLLKNDADSANLGGLVRRSYWAGGAALDTQIFAETGYGIFLNVNGSSSTGMVITSAGNVGIGTSSPVAPLTIAVPAVGSSIGASNAQTAYDYSRLRIKHYSDSNLGLSIGYAGANWTYIQACYNEGSTAPLLLNPYGGEVRVGTGGLKFANGSTALNYYEEGTFTPNNLNSNMSAVTPTFGRYVRIGNQVTINVRWSVEPGGTGQKYLVFNLPFAFNIASGVSYTGSVSNYNSGLSAYSSNVGTSVRNSSGSDTQQYVEAVFISNTSTTMLFSMTYFTF
jgi:hypothetical protein